MTAGPANLLTVWAELLLDTLAEHARDVVISPGSRSTPFALAAARHPALRTHVILDERAAAFYALGLARVTGRPPVLLCTSGTAPAHYYPAVIEASESGLPLLVLSADRPFALAACGAPQTIDQARLFGDHARFFADLGDPRPDGLRGLRRMASRALAEAMGPDPGPVHLNARADKPLEPRHPETDEERALEAFARSLDAPRITLGDVQVDPSMLDALAARIARAQRPAIVAGPLALDAPQEAILELARTRGLALFAEAPSQLRFASRPGVFCADAFDRWLERTPDSPDLVIELGLTPTSAAYARWIERGVSRIVLGGRFRDPSGGAAIIALGALGELVDGLAARLPARPVDPAFAAAIEREERRTWSAIEAALGPALEEGTAARMLLGALPEDALLTVGNSLPIRHLDRFVPGGRPLRVLSQRGVNGIDGVLAGAAGAAIADGGPSAILLGDVTLAHDLASLALCARVRAPLAIVALDNGGGRIFEQLPLGRAGLSEGELSLFTTPPNLDLRAAATAFGVGYADASEPDALRDALERALQTDGATLVHARVPPRGAQALEARIEACLREAR